MAYDDMITRHKNLLFRKSCLDVLAICASAFLLVLARQLEVRYLPQFESLPVLSLLIAIVLLCAYLAWRGVLLRTQSEIEEELCASPNKTIFVYVLGTLGKLTGGEVRYHGQYRNFNLYCQRCLLAFDERILKEDAEMIRVINAYIESVLRNRYMSGEMAELALLAAQCLSRINGEISDELRKRLSKSRSFNGNKMEIAKWLRTGQLQVNSQTHIDR